MKSFFCSIASFALLLTVIACSSPTEDTQSIVVSTEDVVESTRGAESAAEDMHLIFARKWENGNTYVDLKIDGSFEANIQDMVVFGKWNVSDDQKTLNLVGEQSHEGKGTNFKEAYVIVEISNNTMKVLDMAGTEMTFNAI